MQSASPVWCVILHAYKLRHVVNRTGTIFIVKLIIMITSLFHFSIVTHIVNRYNYIIDCKQYTRLYTRFWSTSFLVCSKIKFVLFQKEQTIADKNNNWCIHIFTTSLLLKALQILCVNINNLILGYPFIQKQHASPFLYTTTCYSLPLCDDMLLTSPMLGHATPFPYATTCYSLLLC